MTHPPAKIILASASLSRRQLLAGAGLAFAVVPAGVDEPALRDAALARDAAVPPSRIACLLALAKAEAVAVLHPTAIVIGADQVLALGPRLLEKPVHMAEARAHLRAMRGGQHELHAGLAVLAPGRPAWTHTDTARMTMRAFTDAFLDRYLAEAGPRICQSVGAYQLEGLGITLFERIDGDYFTILGLPLLALLTQLRELGAIPA